MAKELGGEWSTDELEASVEAYLWMLDQEKAGHAYNKMRVNNELRNGPLRLRTKSSVEFRMQNISATLEELCLERIKDYKPAKNVGAKVKDRIRSVLAEKGVYSPDDYAPAVNESELDHKVLKLASTVAYGIPRGTDAPMQVNAQRQVYARDPLVKLWVLRNANGHCEGCGQPAPFTTDIGLPFLEIHHVRPLAEHGSDKHTNAVALCPNCHRRCHLSTDREVFTAGLYERIDRLIR